MKTITVIVEGGMIQDVIGIPKGVRVEVHDYDTEGGDPDIESIETDRQGGRHFVSLWNGTRT